MLSYKINKLELIEKFCINKQETIFKCDGKCHLTTELTKAENQQSAPYSNKISEENSSTLFSIQFKKIKCKNLKKVDLSFDIYSDQKKDNYPNTYFRPPQV